MKKTIDAVLALSAVLANFGYEEILAIMIWILKNHSNFEFVENCKM
jgi:hypothetical protein